MSMMNLIQMLAPLFVGLALMALSVFIKSPLLKIPIIICFYAVVVTPEFNDTWLQTAAIVIMIWAALAGFLRVKENVGA